MTMFSGNHYFSRNHPILTSIVQRDNPGVDGEELAAFVDYELANGGGYVPYTLTDFYGNYLNYRVARFLQRDRGSFASRHCTWDIEKTLDRLAKVAYLSRICGRRITQASLSGIFLRGKGDGKETQEATEWTLYSLGLLKAEKKKDEKNGENDADENEGNSNFNDSNLSKFDDLTFIEDGEDNANNSDESTEDDGEEEETQLRDKNSTTQKSRSKVIKKLFSKRQVKGRSSSDADRSVLDGAKVESKRQVVRRKSKKDVVLCFKEPRIEEFLVARHHFRQCRRKCLTSGILFTQSMRRSIRSLPESGDIWLMTFGLLGQSSETSKLIKAILLEVIEECKLRTRMSPFEITTLCIEAVYESRNAEDLASILEEFTLNQTINYSNSCIDKRRLPYVVSAIGYLVRASRFIYGVHMANFSLNADNIGMLADPLNDVSDNNVQVLNLSCNFDLGVHAVKRLVRFIVKANHLSHLDLSGCRIGNTGLALLSEFFQCCPLNFLNLSSNKIGDVGVQRMTENFKYVVTLEWLDLSDNCITDKSAAILAAALPTLLNLRSLDLRRNLLGDFGTDVLSRSLNRLQHITSLVLAENRIGKRGASALARNLWKTRSLRYVNISLNNIPSSGVTGLKRAASSRGSLHVNVGAQQQQQQQQQQQGARTTTLNDGFAGKEEDEEEEDKDNDEDDDDRSDWRSMTDIFKGVNLLAGRHDHENPTGAERSRRLRPRDSRLRRSWHGLSDSFRRTVSLKKLNRDDDQ